MDANDYSDSGSDEENVYVKKNPSKKVVVYDSDDSYNSENDEPVPPKLEDEEAVVYMPKPLPVTNIDKTTEGSAVKSPGDAMCEFCMLYYPKKIMAKKINPDCFDNQCLHCLYWMNYDEKTRLEFDKLYSQHGMGIAKYILDFSKNHNLEACVRGNVGCFLCDYRLEIEIKNIVDGETINQHIKKSVPNVSSNVTNKNATLPLEEERDIVFNNDLRISLSDVKPVMSVEL